MNHKMKQIRSGALAGKFGLSGAGEVTSGLGNMFSKV